MPSREREKRRTPRLQPFVAPCKLVEGPLRVSGYLTDLSVQGARISSDESLSAGASSIVIEVRFGRRKASSRLPGRVKWQKPGAKPGEASVFGVTFDGITAEEQAVLESVVRDFQQRAALLT